MKPQHLLVLALLATTSARGAHPEDPLIGVEHPDQLELSPLSPSVTYLPLPTEQNSFVSELEGLSGRAPNFFVSSTARHSLGDVYSMRGLTNGLLFTDPSVGLYVDGVPAGHAFGYAEPLLAIDHIDLFRSPQTTLDGLNSEGGLLEIHTRHADPREWHGELSGLYGDFRTIEHRLWVGGPLIKDKLTLEIAGFEGTTQGFVDNTFLGGRRDDRETMAARAVLTWTPTKDWEIIAGYEGTRARDGSSRFTAERDPFQVRSDEEGMLRLNQEREWLTIGRKFDTWEIRSVTSHRSWEADPLVQDGDLSPHGVKPFSVLIPDNAPLAFFGSLPTDGTVDRLSLHEEVWSQEFRVQSLPAAGVPWWRAGLFFQRQRSTGQMDQTRVDSVFRTELVPLPPERIILPGVPFLGIPDESFSVPNEELRDFLSSETLTRRTRFELHEETWAAYLNGGHRWGAFALSGGLRATYTRKTLDRRASDENLQLDLQNFDQGFAQAFAAASAASLALPPGVAAGTPIKVPDDFVKATTTSRYAAEDDDVNVTPTVGLTFDLPQHFQLFAHSSYVVKPGGFNPLIPYSSISHYGREQIWATEAGVRAQAWHGRVQAQLTGYWNEIDDYQLNFGFTGVYNAGRARSRGLELEVAVQLMPGLALSGNAGWNDTELTQFFRGEQAPFVPEFTALIALDYRHRCGFGAHLEFKAIGDTEYTTPNLDLARQDAYGEMNARLGYERGHYGLYLFGRNLTDTQRFTQKNLALGAGSTGEPRILGMMAVLKF